MNTINNDMLMFLNNNTPVTKVTEIVDVKVKDCDDDIGFIGEHYIVKCKVKVDCVVEKTCYVNRKAFKDFRSKTNPIIWN